MPARAPAPSRRSSASTIARCASIERRMCGTSSAIMFRNGPIRIHRLRMIASVFSLAPCA
ncbi:hypothetical protein X976_5315 [Burkholderia pseudomallei MSHR7500]|nr:hypothetical protein X976_5315 [Burkholderia pseudomallei MSHR7500]